MGNFEKELKEYYRSVHCWLPCSGKQKKRILEEIRIQIHTYLLENPHADIQAVEDRFGSPLQIASSYVDAMDTNELLKELRIRRQVMAVVTGVMAVILVIWVGVVVLALGNEFNRADGYYDDSYITSTNITDGLL